MRGLVLLTLVTLVACSRPAPIAPDPIVVAPKDGAPVAKDGASVAADRHFMDTSSGSHDCYDEVLCKQTSPCVDDPNGKYDKAWSEDLHADAGGPWCCYRHTLCEFPAP